MGLQGKDKQDLGFKVFKLSHSPFKVWNTSPQEESLEQQVLEHTTSTEEDSEREDILYAILLHELGLELTIPIEKKTFAGKSVYSIEDDTMLICLEKEITQGVIDAMLEREPGYVIFLDDGFKGNDQLKVNAYESFKTLAESRGADDSETAFRVV